MNLWILIPMVVIAFLAIIPLYQFGPLLLLLGLGRVLAENRTNREIRNANRAAVDRFENQVFRGEQVMDAYSPENVLAGTSIPSSVSFVDNAGGPVNYNKFTRTPPSYGPDGGKPPPGYRPIESPESTLNIPETFGGTADRFGEETDALADEKIPLTGFDLGDYKYDPSGKLNELGESISGSIIGGPSLEEMMTQTGVRGFADRAAAEFPDLESLRTGRISEISRQGAQSQELARQQLLAAYGGDVAQAEEALRQLEFQTSQETGRRGAETEAAFTGLQEEQAGKLADLRAQEASMGTQLAAIASGSETQRAIAAGSIQSQLGLGGEQLNMTNLTQLMAGELAAKGIDFDIQKFNVEFPARLAEAKAALDAGDQDRALQAFMGISGLQLQALGLSAQTQAAMANSLLAAVTAFSETVPDYARVFQEFGNFAMSLLSNKAAAGGGGGGSGIVGIGLQGIEGFPIDLGGQFAV